MILWLALKTSSIRPAADLLAGALTFGWLDLEYAGLRTERVPVEGEMSSA